jgi:hypothetical protein
MIPSLVSVRQIVDEWVPSRLATAVSGRPERYSSVAMSTSSGVKGCLRSTTPAWWRTSWTVVLPTPCRSASWRAVWPFRYQQGSRTHHGQSAG